MGKLALFFAIASGVLLGCSTPPKEAPNTNDQAGHPGNHQMSNVSNSASSPSHDMTGMGESKSAPDAAQQPFDLQFIDTMIAHHQGAVKMAQMALDRSQRGELRTFAQKILSDQSKEIETLREWREEWYTLKPSALNMEMPGMKGMDMQSMANADPGAFDVTFLDMMTPHHDGAIVMAKEALRKAEHKEIRELAKNIISAQAAEIEMMKRWKAAWSKNQ